MAKNKGPKFPSPANVKKMDISSTPKDFKAEVPASETVIEAKSQDLVQIEYKKDNHHVLSGVHALRNGVNHIPRHVWEDVKNHPFILEDIKNGHIVPMSDASEPECEDDADTDEQSDDSTETKKDESKSE